MRTSEVAMHRVMSFNEKEAITDVPLLKKSLFVIGLVILGFVLAHPLIRGPERAARISPRRDP